MSQTKKALRAALDFMRSVRLVPDEQGRRDAHGVKWESSRYAVDVVKQKQAIELVKAALTTPKEL